MDCSNASSEIIEALELLRPPVKRVPDKSWKNKNININSKVSTHTGEIRRLHEYIPKDIIYSKAKEPISSSTSLIEKKSLGRQFLGKYSIISYTTLLHPTYRKDHIQKCSSEDKPLIKVTVIPKTQQTQTGRFHRKPGHNTKRVKKTTSNHENSIHPKKLFLIVSGEKEKIYEIKPSESAQLSCGQIENNFIDGKNVKGIANIKELIKSLEMDKKKRKNKKNKINNDQMFEINENSSSFKECKCKEFSMFGVDQNTNAQHSHVRISGRVGLTEDEKYVLNCTATVDNKPITTISKPIENNSSQFFPSNHNRPKYNEEFKTYVCEVGCNKITSNKNYHTNRDFRDFNMRNCNARCNKFNNNNETETAYDQNNKTYFSKVNNIFKNQRDSNIQVDFENVNCNSENITQNAFRSKKSQSTQIDFNIQLPNINSLRNQDKDERNQCKCNNLDNIKSTLEKDVKENSLRAYHSPLVIISVYPKQDNSETTKIQKKPAIEDFWRSQPSEKYVSNGSSKRPEKRQTNNIKSNLGIVRSSRSPSPIKDCCVPRNKNNNQFETRILQTAKRKGSPPRHFNGVTNNMTENKEKVKQQNKFAINKRNTCTTQNQETMRACHVNSVLKSREPKNVQAQLKKTLVEDYTKMLTGNINGNCCRNDSKNENSKINVKIDGDHENYDLLFNQGKLKTDFRIRKTVKEAGSQKHEHSSNKTRKDFSILSTDPTRRKLTPEKQIYQSNGVLDSQNHTSTLNPRDSIEIFHRRETSHRMKDTETHQSTKESDKNENNTEFFAPVKHYRGDDCEIPDPVERDKQIRELLGIAKDIPTTSKLEHKLGSVSEDHSLIQCFYSKTCIKHLECRVSTYKSYPCCCMNDKNEEERSSGEYGNEYCHKNIGTEPSVDESSLYQQLILNRNIQIFLQVEQFTKQKPIILSRKQYNKVKKIIQKTISRRVCHDKCKNSIISIGEVRRRTKPDTPVECEYPKCTQTNSSATVCNETKKDRKKYSFCSYKNCFEQRQVQTVFLFDSKKAEHSNIMDTTIKEATGNSEKRAVSSLEIHYTNVAYMKSDTFSSTNVESLSSTSFNKRNNSLYTIFKVPRKTPTPNLGTSVLSLITNSTKLKSKCLESSSSTPNIKAKKPFLRRLMSCLVMQSRISEKIPTKPTPKAPSANSSLDSYHINTSLGAIEMSSSVYDTSGSFYSNHDVCPVVNNKMKRGFFSSVKGFLTNL